VLRGHRSTACYYELSKRTSQLHISIALHLIRFHHRAQFHHHDYQLRRACISRQVTRQTRTCRLTHEQPSRYGALLHRLPRRAYTIRERNASVPILRRRAPPHRPHPGSWHPGPGTQAKVQNTCGLEHIAFSLDSLSDLLLSYRQRKQKKILPLWPVNHGPTTSIYYSDPDSNEIETKTQMMLQSL
jgi:hypothetical protein